MDTQPAAPLSVPPRANSWRLVRIVWAFVAVVVLLLLFSYFSIGLMSAGRAYVGGESLWSKAQKEAVSALSRYAVDHRPEDYQAYRSALEVSLGDRMARLEMAKPNPDRSIAVRGFLQGRNHLDDTEGMIDLMQRFGSLPEIRRAVNAWVAADQLMDQLMALGDQIHAAVGAGTLDAIHSKAYQTQIQELDRQFTPQEDEFSYALGVATRKTTTVLRLTMLIVASVLVSIAYIFSIRMVSHSEKIHQALLESESQLRNVLQYAPLPIMIARLDEPAILYANQHALAQLKVSSELLSVINPSSLYVHPDEREHLLQSIRTHGNVRDWEMQMQDIQGKPFWALLSSQRIVFSGQACTLTTLHNIDERKHAQEALRHRAFHDDLTSLPNRAMFMDALNRTLHRVERKNGSFSILFIDLDRFKQINDTLGHAMGDLLLQEVAMRIRLCVREGDLVARLGGDEFVILVEDGSPPESVKLIAEKVQTALAPAHQLGEHSTHVTASIGISNYPQDGTEINDLLRRADAAMYSVKYSGGASISSFSGSLN